MLTLKTSKAERAARVNLARDLVPMPRKPIPVLLVLITVYVDAIDARDLFTWGHGVDPGKALGELRRTLDAAEVQDFPETVRRWSVSRGATWKGT